MSIVAIVFSIIALRSKSNFGGWGSMFGKVARGAGGLAGDMGKQALIFGGINAASPLVSEAIDKGARVVGDVTGGMERTAENVLGDVFGGSGGSGGGDGYNEDNEEDNYY